MTLSKNADGRPILTGASRLPPMQPTNAPEAQRTTNAKQEPKQKTRDRFTVLNSFVDSTMHKLTRREIAVWLILYRDTRHGTARTSQENIARRAGMSVRSVKVATGKLIDAGLLLECSPKPDPGVMKV